MLKYQIRKLCVLVCTDVHLHVRGGVCAQVHMWTEVRGWCSMSQFFPPYRLRHDLHRPWSKVVYPINLLNMILASALLTTRPNALYSRKDKYI